MTTSADVRHGLRANQILQIDRWCGSFCRTRVGGGSTARYQFFISAHTQSFRRRRRISSARGGIKKNLVELRAIKQLKRDLNDRWKEMRKKRRPVGAGRRRVCRCRASRDRWRANHSIALAPLKGPTYDARTAQVVDYLSATCFSPIRLFLRKKPGVRSGCPTACAALQKMCLKVARASRACAVIRDSGEMSVPPRITRSNTPRAFACLFLLPTLA